MARTPQKRHCSAHSVRTGQPCRAWAVTGATVCVAHGGAAPQVKAAAEARVGLASAQRAVATLGLSREIEPHQALVEELWRAAGLVEWVSRIVAGLDAEAEISAWFNLYQAERDRMVRAARAAINAGVAEREIALAEEQGRIIAQVLERSLVDLGLNVADQRTREVVRLRLAEAGAGR